MNERFREFLRHPVSQVFGIMLGGAAFFAAGGIADFAYDRPSDAEVAAAQAAADEYHAEDSLLFADAAHYEDLLITRENHAEVLRYTRVASVALAGASAYGLALNIAAVRRQDADLAAE